MYPFFLTPLPRRFKSFNMESIKCGCVRCIVPFGFLSMLTPRKSSSVPSILMSSLTLRICAITSSISYGSGPARIESSVYSAYMTFPL